VIMDLVSVANARVLAELLKGEAFEALNAPTTTSK